MPNLKRDYKRISEELEALIELEDSHSWMALIGQQMIAEAIDRNTEALNKIASELDVGL